MQDTEKTTEQPFVKTGCPHESASELNAPSYAESIEQTAKPTANSQPGAQDCPNSTLLSASLDMASLDAESQPSGISEGKEHKRSGAPTGNENRKSHGDYQRQRFLRERRRKAIKGNTRNGKAAQEWRQW